MMKRLYIRKTVSSLLAALLCILIIAPAAFASSNSKGNERDAGFVTTVYNENSGLPTGEANCVLQSRDGYIWAGSYGGLIRYDGSSITNFNDLLGTSAVRSVFEGSDGRLFIGTNDAGAFIYDINNGFEHIDCSDSNSFLCIRCFYESRSGSVYVASASGIAVIKDGQLTPLFKSETGTEQIMTLAEDADGVMYALDGSGNLYSFKEDVFIAKENTSRFFAEGNGYAINSDRDGNVYIGSSMHEVAVLGTGTVIDCGDVAAINYLLPKDDGTVLVCGVNGFGYIENNEFVHVSPEGISVSAVWADRDYDGNYWVASTSSGLIRYSKSYFADCNMNSGLTGININAVHKEYGCYYVGTDNGLMMFDGDWHQIENRLTEKLSGVRIRNITSDIYGNVFFASYSPVCGALRYTPETGEMKNFGLAEGIQSETIRVVYSLSDGRVLVGNQLGADIISGDDVVESYGADSGLSSTSVLCALETGGRIFIGTDGAGIYEITGSGLFQYSKSAGIESGVILRMVADADAPGHFYACAGERLYYYNGTAFRQIKGIDQGAGSIFNVYDRDGKLWILQNDGILCADKAKLLSFEDAYTEKYSFESGLPGSLNANTWNYLDADGTLYLATRNGVCSFAFEPVDVHLPFSIVNSVTVDDVVYEHPESITLDKNAGRITIDVSSLLLSDVKSFTMSYQLVGFDRAPLQTNEKHVAVGYTNIPGGSYDFSVTVTDPATGEEANHISIPVFKEKKLRETIWLDVIIAVAIIGATAVVAVIISRVKIELIRKRQEQLAEITDQALETIARTIDAKDHYTRGHSSRVAIYSREIAARSGYSEEDCHTVYYIGLLHDIGKIGVPDDVLNKPGRLTDEEFKIIRSHPRMGGEILKGFTAIPGIADGARYHHERYDGKGYNEGLAGENIPEIARIICVADCYDAMKSTRCYRPGLSDEVIRNELIKGSGLQFDPKYVEIMLQMMDDGTAPAES